MTPSDEQELFLNRAPGPECNLTEFKSTARTKFGPSTRILLAAVAAIGVVVAICMSRQWPTSSAKELRPDDVGGGFLSEVLEEYGTDKNKKSNKDTDDSEEEDSAEKKLQAKIAAETKKLAAEKKAAKKKLAEEKAAALALKDAEKLIHKAKDEKEESDDLKDKAEHLQTKAEKMINSAGDLSKKASDEKDTAKTDREKAKELRDKVAELREEAKHLDRKAESLDKDALEEKKDAKKEKGKALALKKKAESQEREAEKVKDASVATETEALDKMAAARVCIHLPGVKVKAAGDVLTFPPIVGEHNNTDEWKCTDWCLKHKDCKQAVFTWETKTCELFGERSEEPHMFRERWPWYNTSYCGMQTEKEDMLKSLKKIYDAKPWVPPPHNCSWAGDNCLATQCCADVCKANWDFTKCDWYTCWKRDENWAGCEMNGAPEGWDGTKLGGHPNSEIGPAEDGKLIQGTKLYCFSVVMWNQPPTESWQDSEGQIADHWKTAEKNILQCDDYSFFDGLEGGSVHNINSFVEAWKKVKDDGRWKNNDWSIKVDPDAVFFPEHFRSKVKYNWKTPQGSTVYLRNTFYKFQFLGALEALTREAMEIYFERGYECEEHLGFEGGEDYWMLQCLEGLGIDYQTDVTLLHDKYAADQNCGDPNGVAFHFFKKIEGGDGWDVCWDTANEAWNNEHPER